MKAKVEVWEGHQDGGKAVRPFEAGGMVSPRRHLRDQHHRTSLPLPPRSAAAAVTATDAATTATPTGLTTTAATAAPAQPPLMGSPSPAAASGTSRTRPFHGTKESGTAKQQHRGRLFLRAVEFHWFILLGRGVTGLGLHTHKLKDCLFLQVLGDLSEGRNSTWTLRQHRPRRAQPAPKWGISSRTWKLSEG